METNVEAVTDEGLVLLHQLDTRLSKFMEIEKRRSLWKDGLIPVLSLVVALAGILSSGVIQVLAIKSQSSLKQYEVTFIAKQRAYTEILSSMNLLYYSCEPLRREDMFRGIDKLQTDTYSVEPFMRESQKAVLSNNIQSFIGICLNHFSQPGGTLSGNDQWASNYVRSRDKVRKSLSVALFGIESTRN